MDKFITEKFLQENCFSNKNILRLGNVHKEYKISLIDEHKRQRDYVTYYEIEVLLDIVTIYIKAIKIYKNFIETECNYKHAFSNLDFTKENLKNMIVSVTKNSDTIEPKIKFNI